MGGVSPLSGLEPVLFRQRVHRLTVYTLFEDTFLVEDTPDKETYRERLKTTVVALDLHDGGITDITA